MSLAQAVEAQAHDRHLLDLFVQNTRKNLEQEILDACRDSIDRAIDQAVASLKSSIESHYDVLRHQTVHVISVRRC